MLQDAGLLLQPHFLAIVFSAEGNVVHAFDPQGISQFHKPIDSATLSVLYSLVVAQHSSENVASCYNKWVAGSPSPRAAYTSGRTRSLEGLLETSHGLGIGSTMALPCDACTNGGDSQWDAAQRHPGPLAFVVLQDVHDVTWLRSSAQFTSPAAVIQVSTAGKILYAPAFPAATGNAVMYYVHPADMAAFCRGMRSVSICGTGCFTARLRVVRVAAASGVPEGKTNPAEPTPNFLEGSGSFASPVLSRRSALRSDMSPNPRARLTRDATLHDDAGFPSRPVETPEECAIDMPCAPGREECNVAQDKQGESRPDEPPRGSLDTARPSDPGGDDDTSIAMQFWGQSVAGNIYLSISPAQEHLKSCPRASMSQATDTAIAVEAAANGRPHSLPACVCAIQVFDPEYTQGAAEGETPFCAAVEVSQHTHWLTDQSGAFLALAVEKLRLAVHVVAAARPYVQGLFLTARGILSLCQTAGTRLVSSLAANAGSAVTSATTALQTASDRMTAYNLPGARSANRLISGVSGMLTAGDAHRKEGALPMATVV